MAEFRVSYDTKTIQELVFFYKNKQLNLEPGFQRESVWTLKDRQKLIESILGSRPVPSIFLYRSQDSKGRLKYDVIDGKQRIETVLMFQSLGSFRGSSFPVTAALSPDQQPREWTWVKLRKKHGEAHLMSYQLQTVEVAGDLADIIDLFVRINSTGKHLSTAEKRHAKYYHSPFLRTAARVAHAHEAFFLSHRIVSRTQLTRMKHVELTCELMASMLADGLINKKSALDKVIGGHAFTARTIDRTAKDLGRLLRLTGRMFPRLRETRFGNSVDFYSLFMFLWDLDRRHAILTDRSRNAQAATLLAKLSVDVDTVRQLQKKLKGAGHEYQLASDYLLTIQGDTDSLATRQRRQKVLDKLLGGLFERKDERRLFTPEQRRLIWQSDDKKRCATCGETLDWSNFTVDHVKPHSRGGRTSLRNAKLLCRSCNSRKGNRR